MGWPSCRDPRLLLHGFGDVDHLDGVQDILQDHARLQNVVMMLHACQSRRHLPIKGLSPTSEFCYCYHVHLRRVSARVESLPAFFLFLTRQNMYYFVDRIVLLFVTG